MEKQVVNQGVSSEGRVLVILTGVAGRCYIKRA
jgi:hypothetical protein